jgi:hypothetical protein
MEIGPAVCRRVMVAWAALLLSEAAFGQSPHLPQFGIVSVTYRDLDGDQDPFPDAGETGRLSLTVRNGQFAYTGASLVLITTDPQVDCISEPRVAIGDLAPGQIVLEHDLRRTPLQCPGRRMGGAARR